MARLDDGADQARDADPVGAHMDEVLAAVGGGDLGAHRLRIFRAEIEDVADLDPARGDPLLLGDGGEGGGIVLLVGRRVGRRPRLDDRRQVRSEVRIRPFRPVETLDEVFDIALLPASKRVSTHKTEMEEAEDEAAALVVS